MNYSFENVLLRYNTLHVFDELEGFLNIIVFEIIDYEIESCLWNHINQRRKSLESILSTSKNDKIMA